MSNHLVTQQFQFPEGQMLHMDHLPERMNSSTADVQNKMVVNVSHNPASAQFMVSNEQPGSVEPMSNNFGLQNLMVSNYQMGQIESKAGTLGFGAGEVMPTNVDFQKAFLPSKRKAEMDATGNSVSQHSLVPNNRTMQMGTSPHYPQLLRPSSSNKKSMQMQSKVGPSNMQNMPASNKKMVRIESIPNKSGSHRVQTPKSRTAQNEPFSKVKTESFGNVRSKMREQLAAALALASQNQDKTANAENNDAEVSINQHNHQDSNENAPSGESCSAGKSDNAQGFPAKLPTTECMGNPPILLDEDVSFSDNFFVKDELLQGNGLSWALDIDMQAMEEKEPHNTEKSKVLHDEGGGNASEQTKPSPENLASEIEAELFKLFGGVNKKYKEKGRSLLFNLKDRNNPDLRERVMSGEITPERLCSMTAEELASEELSQWRMAKAEELAQMVVLPDTDLDRRRLVKKTHKGEYQVEMEEDDSVLVEVSGGSSSLSQTQSKTKDVQTHSAELEVMKDREKTTSQKTNSENQDGSFIIPSDGTDLMQGMMVDELKDSEHLPPIISLDEFMESLNSEPPFEILQVDAGSSMPSSQKEQSEAGKKVAGSDSTSIDHGDTPDKADEVVMKPAVGSDSTSKDHGDTPERADEVAMKPAVGETVKRSVRPVVQNISPPGNSATFEHIWEGVLQLSISSSIKTVGVYQSGEKTSISEWPSSLEIKGRVRLDAFEKFIKDLPLSRSRAVMVIHFVLKDNSADSERANLREAIESYVSDDRLGFAEPAPGVELYLCPTRGRVVDMLSNYLSKDRTDIFNSSDNGLIGIVVWRKAHPISSTISPNSTSSQQKHSSLKRQHFTSRRHQEKDANVNVNMMNKVPPASYDRPPSQAVIPPPPSDDGDTDIPPGFGPPVTGREDDDLPEFNFSRNVNLTVSPRPSSQNLRHGSRTASFNSAGSRSVDQIRELIHKYGQTGASDNSKSWLDNRGSGVSLGIEPWNDDDDDDIPEWQPQATHQIQQPRPPIHGFHQPLEPTYGSQNTVPTLARQQLNPSMNIVNGSASTRHQGARWAQQPGDPGNAPSGGQYHGMPGVPPGLRQDSSRSRGF